MSARKRAPVPQASPERQEVDMVAKHFALVSPLALAVDRALQEAGRTNGPSQRRVQAARHDLLAAIEAQGELVRAANLVLHYLRSGKFDPGMRPGYACVLEAALLKVMKPTP